MRIVFLLSKLVLFPISTKEPCTLKDLDGQLLAESLSPPDAALKWPLLKAEDRCSTETAASL